MSDRWGETPYDFRAERHEAENDDPPRRRVGTERVPLDDLPDLTESDYRW